MVQESKVSSLASLLQEIELKRLKLELISNLPSVKFNASAGNKSHCELVVKGTYTY